MAPAVSMAPVLQTPHAPTTSEQETQFAVHNLIMSDSNKSFLNSDPAATYVATLKRGSEPVTTVPAYGDNLESLSNMLDDFVDNPPDATLLQSGSILDAVCSGDNGQHLPQQTQQQQPVQKYSVNRNELLSFENYVSVDQQQHSDLEQQQQREQQQSDAFQEPIDISDGESDNEQLPPSPLTSPAKSSIVAAAVTSPGVAKPLNGKINRHAFDLFKENTVKKAKSIEDLGIGAINKNGGNSSITSGDNDHKIATTSSSDVGRKRAAGGELKVDFNVSSANVSVSKNTTDVTATVSTPISTPKQAQQQQSVDTNESPKSLFTGNALPNRDGRQTISGGRGVGIGKRLIRISDSNKKAYSSDSSDSEEEEEKKNVTSSSRKNNKKRGYDSANDNNSASSDSGSSSSGDSSDNESDNNSHSGGSGSCDSDEKNTAGDRQKAVPAKRFTKKRTSPATVAKSAPAPAPAVDAAPVVSCKNGKAPSKKPEAGTLSGSESEVEVVASDSEGEPGPTKAKRQMTAADGGHAVFTSDLIKLQRKVECNVDSKLEALREQLKNEHMAEFLAMEEKINSYCEKLVKATAMTAHANAVSAAADSVSMPPPPSPACPPPRPASYTSMSNGSRKKMSDQPMTVANFLKFMLHLDPHPIPHKSKLYPVPDFDNNQAFSHLPAYLLLNEDDPALKKQDLKIMSEKEFRYILRCGFEWDEESDIKLKKCLNLGPEQQDCVDVNFFVNDFIVRIYNKLSEAASQNNLTSLTEILIFRFLSHIKVISGGSFTQASARAHFLKEKRETEMARETMTDRLCCVACQSARVQYGWVDMAKRKLNLKFCSACMLNQKEKCLELCKNDSELQRAGIEIKTEKDMRKYFMIVSFAGKKLSIKKGAKLAKSGASAVMSTPRREADDPDINTVIVDSDVEDNCADETTSRVVSGAQKRPAPSDSNPPRPDPQPSTSSAPDQDITRTALNTVLASIPNSALASSEDCKQIVDSMMGSMNVRKIIEQVEQANEQKIREMRRELEQSNIALALQKKQFELEQKRASELSQEPSEPPSKKQKKSRAQSKKSKTTTPSSSGSRGKGSSRGRGSKKPKSVEFVDDQDDC